MARFNLLIFSEWFLLVCSWRILVCSLLVMSFSGGSTTVVLASKWVGYFSLFYFKGVCVGLMLFLRKCLLDFTNESICTWSFFCREDLKLQIQFLGRYRVGPISYFFLGRIFYSLFQFHLCCENYWHKVAHNTPYYISVSLRLILVSLL